MNKGSSLYYYGHIANNLQKVDLRTSNYIRHRKQFLKQYCSPLQIKITQLNNQIQYYQHLIQNQNEMIQNEQQVSKLKKQIIQYKKTQQYFLSHLQLFQQKIMQLVVENNVIGQQIYKIKHNLSQLTHQKSKMIYEQLNTQRLLDRQQIKSKDNKSYFSNLNKSRTILKQSNLTQSQYNYSSYTKKSSSNSKIQPNIVLPQCNNNLLPTIFRVQKYYVNKQTCRINNKFEQKNMIKNNKSITNSLHNNNTKIKNNINNNTKQQQLTINNSIQPLLLQQNISLSLQSPLKINHHSKQLQLIHKQQQLKYKFKKLTSSYNKFELLFKQCYDKKISHTQKSVTQLQSKLISDRQKFLSICQAISQKNIHKITFNQFQKLTGDQIMTLFISFPWIQKKLFKPFIERRKFIIQMQSIHKYI